MEKNFHICILTTISDNGSKGELLGVAISTTSNSVTACASMTRFKSIHRNCLTDPTASKACIYRRNFFLGRCPVFNDDLNFQYSEVPCYQGMYLKYKKVLTKFFGDTTQPAKTFKFFTTKYFMFFFFQRVEPVRIQYVMVIVCWVLEMSNLSMMMVNCINSSQHLVSPNIQVHKKRYALRHCFNVHATSF